MINESIVYPERATVNIFTAGFGLPNTMQAHTRQIFMFNSDGMQLGRVQNQKMQTKNAIQKEQPVSLKTAILLESRKKDKTAPITFSIPNHCTNSKLGPIVQTHEVSQISVPYKNTKS